MSKNKYDNLNAPLILVVGIVSTLFVVDMFVGTQALTYHLANNNFQRDVVAPTMIEKQDHLIAQNKLLGIDKQGNDLYVQVEQSTDRVKIPVSRAMELYVQRFSGPSNQ